MGLLVVTGINSVILICVEFVLERLNQFNTKDGFDLIKFKTSFYLGLFGTLALAYLVDCDIHGFDSVAELFRKIPSN